MEKEILGNEDMNVDSKGKVEKELEVDYASLENVFGNEDLKIAKVEDIKAKKKSKRCCKNNKVKYEKEKDVSVLEKMCIICGKSNSPGILIMDKKICTICEEKAVKADIKSDFYEDYKDKITKNVVGKMKNLG